jgi:glucose-1-phosphate thymidylyltransferase
MSNQGLKVVIPMAGLGTRLRPHTWSKPKQLVSVAGKTVLDHVIDSLDTLPEPNNFELVSIVGYLGDQIEAHVKENYPKLESHFVIQENPLGQSHAIKLAEKYLQGPLLIVFADTLLKTDLSFLNNEQSDAVAWVKPVDDPRRFGVAELGEDGLVTRLIEKPENFNNNLAVVGFYYFRRGQDLIDAIDEQMKMGLDLNGEFYLADAINIMLATGMKMRTEIVDIWLDAGTPASLLKTNRYLLEHDRNNDDDCSAHKGVVIIPPVFIHPTAKVKTSIIGPYVSLGAGCNVKQSIIQDSILEDDAQVIGVILEKSMVGRSAQLRRRAGVVNAGDNTNVTI